MPAINPLVSVVIPAYNRAHLIEDALGSVYAQTFNNYEVILIDDGSTDGTEELIKSKYAGKLRYIKQENRGISGARNRGIEEAAGKYIAFLDSDDLWLPEKLEKQVSYMEAQSEIGLTCTKLNRYAVGKESEKSVCPDYFSSRFEDLLNSSNYIPTTTVMVRREVFQSVGLFDTALQVAGDFDLWLRIMKKYPIAMLEDILAEHRDHAKKTTRDLTKVYEGYWKFYAKTLKLYGKEVKDYKAYRDRGASFEYLLGAEYLKQGKPRLALTHIRGALRLSPKVGSCFNNRLGLGPFLLILKPYFVCFYATLLSLLKIGEFSRGQE